MVLLIQRIIIGVSFIIHYNIQFSIWRTRLKNLINTRFVWLPNITGFLLLNPKKKKKKTFLSDFVPEFG